MNAFLSILFFANSLQRMFISIPFTRSYLKLFGYFSFKFHYKLCKMYARNIMLIVSNKVSGSWLNRKIRGKKDIS